MKPLFAPSMMCMDITKTKEQLAVLNRYCDLYHVDIMDGHFVKNIALSVDFIKAIKPLATLPIDAHMMVTDPSNYLHDLAKSGASYITVHVETVTTNAFRVLRDIRLLGCKAGIAVCPLTPLSSFECLLGEIDIITLMTVDPGYVGNKFIPQMIDKVAAVNKIRQQQKYDFIIQCDGAIGKETYKPLYDGGARAFVMGSSGLFFKNTVSNLEEACLRMHNEFETSTGVATWMIKE